MNIPEKIKGFRTKKGISQTDIAEKLNISQSTYFQIEKGNTELTITRLYEIAKALEISVSELLGEPSQTSDNERIKELEKRVLELEDRIKDKESRLNSETQRIQSLQDDILDYLLNIIAQSSPLSKTIVFNKRTKKKAELLHNEDIGLSLYHFSNPENKQEWVKKIGNFESKDIVLKWVLPEEVYQKEVNKFFYNLLHADSEYSIGEFCRILLDYKIIDDKIIKNAVEKYADVVENGFGSDEEIDEDLRIVKNQMEAILTSKNTTKN